MNKEQYVTFEVAKLLKEKGFDWFTFGYYTMDDYESPPYFGIENLCTDNWNGKVDEVNDLWFSAPTQQMALHWLREVHKIDISVIPDDGSWWIKITELESWSGVFNGKVLNSDDIKFAYKGATSTKEECYDAALWYVLNNLI